MDEQRDTVVVHYTVTAAHLLPQQDGTAATGHVSVVSGMDKIHFTRWVEWVGRGWAIDNSRTVHILWLMLRPRILAAPSA